MVTVEVGNSYTTIKGLSPKDEKALREALSYSVGSYHSGFGVRRKSLLDKSGEFATGLLQRVLSYLYKNKIRIHLIDLIAPKYRQQPTIDGYPWQNDALRAAVNRGRGIISAVTGSGKSRVIKMLAQHYGLRTLVVVPSLEIKRQLSETLEDLPNVVVENIDSTVLSKIKNIDVLIIDEGHHSAAKTYQKLNKTAWTGIYYRFFLTATPFRNDPEEELLFEGIAGQIVYKLDYKSAVANKYVMPLEAYFLSIPTKTYSAVTYAQVYSELVVHNTVRNEIISNLLKSLDESSVYTLCLVKEVAHGKILAELTGLPFASGEDDDSRHFIRHFNNGGIKTLIGTEGILSEGVDTKPCEWVIVAGLGKAKSQLQQKIGRALRIYPGKESAKVVLMRDKSHRFTLRHYNEQVKILKDEYEVIPSVLNI